MKARPLAALVLLFSCFLLAVFWPTFSQGLILACEDGRVQNYPAFAAPIELWSDLILCGWPVMADPQVSSFYPVRWLCSFLPGGFNCYVFSGYLLAMTFAAVFAYHLTARFRGGKGSLSAAAVAGIVYGGGGFLFSELNHVQIVHTAAWLPLLLFLADKILGGALSLVPAFALTFAVAFFAGHPQSFFYSLFVLLLYIFLGRSVEFFRGRSRPLLFLLGAILAGTLICAVQLLPTYELTRQSARAVFGFSDFTFGQLTPFDYLGFLFPYLLGGHFGTLGAVQVVNQGVSPGYFFFGFTPIILSIYIGAKRFREPLVRFFLFLFWFAVFFSLGDRTPLAWLLYYVPGFALFRAPYRIIMLAALALAMLSALAIAEIEKQAQLPGRAPQLPFGQFLKRKSAVKHLVLMLTTLACGLSSNLLFSALSLFWFASKPRLISSRYILVVASALSLSTYAINADWTRQTQTAKALTEPFTAAALKTELGQWQRCFSLLGIEAGREEMPPNLSRLWGIANASGYEPLMYRRYSELLDISEAGFMKPPWRIEGGNRAFDLAAVKYIIAPGAEVGRSFLSEQAKKFWRPRERGNMTYFENTRVLPRYFLATESRLLKAEQILSATRTSVLPDGSTFEPSRQVLLEAADAPVLAGSSSPTDAPTLAGAPVLAGSPVLAGPPVLTDPPVPGGTVAPSARVDLLAGPGLNTRFDSLVGLNFDTLLDLQSALAGQPPCETPSDRTWLTLRTKASVPSYLVMLDQFYPGFYAFVDGEAVPLYRADYCYRAVSLSAGEHIVRIVLKPRSFLVGFALTMLGFSVCEVLVLLSKRKSKGTR